MLSVAVRVGLLRKRKEKTNMAEIISIHFVRKRNNVAESCDHVTVRSNLELKVITVRTNFKLDKSL